MASGSARPTANSATIRFLSSRSPENSKPHLEGFLRGLGAFGYVDGKTAKIEYRWANGQYDQLRKLAGELAALQPAIIAAAGGAPFARRQSPSQRPSLSYLWPRSVSEGIVAILNQPGANVTGVDLMSGELTGNGSVYWRNSCRPALLLDFSPTRKAFKAACVRTL